MPCLEAYTFTQTLRQRVTPILEPIADSYIVIKRLYDTMRRSIAYINFQRLAEDIAVSSNVPISEIPI